MAKRRQPKKSRDDLIEAMHFMEGVTAKIHGLLDETRIYRTVRKEFAKSERYTATVLLLTDDASKLKTAETSLSSKRRKSGRRGILPRAPRPRLKGRKIALKESPLLSKVVRDGETIQSRLSELVRELFPRPVANLLLKDIKREKTPTVLTPLKRRGKVVGAFAMSSPQLSEPLIPSVERLAQHISTALALAKEYADRKQAEDELRNSREELRSLSAYLQSVREDERTHIAREMHDELGQTLTALKLDLLGLRDEPPKGKKSLLENTESMLTLTDRTIETVRRISAELRPKFLDDLGLAAAMKWQAEEFQNRTGIECTVTVGSDDMVLDKELSTAVFRIFQEGLTNVARHANASRVEVSFRQKGSKLEMKVADNGRGIPEEQISASKSFGIMGMRERVRSLGGEFKVKGVKNKGTTVRVVIPIEEPRERRPVSTPRLVGREKEIRKLKSLLRRAERQEGRLVLIHGEAGIGKTRLVTDLGHDLETRGGTVLLGRCREDTSAIAYYPLREAFSRFLEVRKEEGLAAFENLPDYSKWELSRIVPELRETQPPEFEPAKDHFRLFEAFRLFLQNLATRSKGALLVILEDLHLSGEATLDLLHYLARNLREGSVLLCATYRTEEAGESLQRFTASLNKEKLSEALALRPLSSRDVSAMVDLLYRGGEATDELRDVVYKRTEGNPFFVEELTKLVPEEEFAEGPGKTKEIPKSIQAVLKRRVGSLDLGVREILSCAAVVGEEFEFEVLRGALDRPEMEVMEAVEVGARSHIVRESTRGAEERYRFIHALMADVLYSGIGKARRKLWHERVGETLEDVYAGRLAQLNGQLTYHFELGENWEKACTYALTSAKQAEEAYTNQEAIRLYEKAREILPRLTRNVDDESIAIAKGLGDVHKTAGDYERAIQEYRLMGEQARKGGDRKRTGEALTGIGELHRRRGSYDEALRHLEESLAAAKEMGDKEGTARSLNQTGVVYQMKGVCDEALTYHREALTISEEIGDRKGTADSLQHIGTAYGMKGSLDEALRYFGKALTITKEIADKSGMAHSLNNMGVIYDMKGSYGEALKYHEEALALWREMGNKSAVALSLHNLGIVYPRKGSYEQALGYLEEALAIRREMGGESFMHTSLWNIGAVHVARGSYDEASRYLEEALGAARGRGTEMALALQLIAAVHQSRGSYDKALRYCEDALATCETGRKRGRAWALLAKGGLSRELGLLREARNLHERALSLAKEIGDREAENVASTELGADMLRFNRAGRALSRINEALASATDTKNIEAQIQALQRFGETHMARGNPDEAGKVIDRLVSTAEKTDSERWRGQAYVLKARFLSPSDQALPYAEKALKLSQKMGTPEQLWRCYQVFGRVHRQKGDSAKAREHYRKAKEIVESIASRISDPKIREAYVNKPEHKELRKECEQLSHGSKKKVRKS